MKTIYQLLPITQEAKDWVEENVVCEPWQKLGDSICIEHGYIADVVVGMMEDGLIPCEDFQVS